MTFQRATIAAALLLVSGGLVGIAQTQTPPPAAPDAQHDHNHDAPAPSGAAGNADMMKMQQTMMQEMKAADERLQKLVTAMNAAKGDAQIAAIAKTVTELAEQQRTMHSHMAMMHDQMMPMMMGRGGMMKP